MPIYEYECQACGDVQELMQKISDPQPTACPVCHKGPIVKLMSRTAFILKGEGWYVTDFRDKGKKPVKAADKEGGEAAVASVDKPANGAAAGDGKTADAKPSETTAPAAKTESKPEAAPSVPAKTASGPSI